MHILESSGRFHHMIKSSKSKRENRFRMKHQRLEDSQLKEELKEKDQLIEELKEKANTVVSRG